MLLIIYYSFLLPHMFWRKTLEESFFLFCSNPGSVTFLKQHRCHSEEVKSRELEKPKTLTTETGFFISLHVWFGFNIYKSNCGVSALTSSKFKGYDLSVTFIKHFICQEQLLKGNQIEDVYRECFADVFSENISRFVDK